MKFRLCAIIGVVFLALALIAKGQDNARDNATTAPATQPAHKMEMPPGFHVVTVGDRSALCQPDDDAWVKQTLASVSPATRPTTMPSDMTATIGQHRAELTRQMVQDLGLGDSKMVDDFLDTKLLPELAKVAALKPTIYYFVATRAKAADLMAGGWSDPFFHFIRFAHDVSYSPRVMIKTDGSMDDLVWWVEIHDGDNTATRQDAMSGEIQFFESNFILQISMMGRNQAEHLFEQFIHEKVIKPLKLPASDDWFDFGASNIYAIKYSALVTGDSRKTWTEQLIGRPGEARGFTSLDLMNPMNPAEIRPEYMTAYNSALLRKGAVVIDYLLAKAGDGSLAKVLPAFQAKPPATPQELVKEVQDATGVDLTPVMAPDFGGPATQPAAGN